MNVLRGDEADQRAVASTSGSFLTLRSTISRSAASSVSSPCPTTSYRLASFARPPFPRVVDEADVAFGQQALQLPRVIDHDQRARAAPAHQRHRFGERGLGRRRHTDRG